MKKILHDYSGLFALALFPLAAAIGGFVTHSLRGAWLGPLYLLLAVIVLFATFGAMTMVESIWDGDIATVISHHFLVPQQLIVLLVGISLATKGVAFTKQAAIAFVLVSAVGGTAMRFLRKEPR